MRALLQRVKKASVTVDSKVVGSIDGGFVVLLGVGKGDCEKDVDYLVKKIVNLRVFADENGKFNKSIKDVSGQCLVVSQFTLYADTKGGNRPSFTDAALPDLANKLYEEFCRSLKGEGVKVETGVFGAMMDVELINDGPVTVMLDTRG